MEGWEVLLIGKLDGEDLGSLDGVEVRTEQLFEQPGSLNEEQVDEELHQ